MLKGKVALVTGPVGISAGDRARIGAARRHGVGTATSDNRAESISLALSEAGGCGSGMGLT